MVSSWQTYCHFISIIFILWINDFISKAGIQSWSLVFCQNKFFMDIDTKGSASMLDLAPWRSVHMFLWLNVTLCAVKVFGSGTRLYVTGRKKVFFHCLSTVYNCFWNYFFKLGRKMTVVIWNGNSLI